MAGFKPFGMPLCELDVVKLQYDEYESINLVNYMNLPQEVAAEKMDISRPTFTRIYNCALKKIAQAFVECKARFGEVPGVSCFVSAYVIEIWIQRHHHESHEWHESVVALRRYPLFRYDVAAIMVILSGQTGRG